MAVRFSYIVLALLVVSAAGVADELQMKNGSRLVGTLISADQEKVVFDTPFAGEITIQQANIEVVHTQNEVTVLMQDGLVYRNKKIVALEDELIVFDEDQNPRAFDVLDIKMVNPEPWLLGEGYQWLGQVNTALKSERGNTDTDELDLDFETSWRSLKDRYTVRGLWEIDRTNGIKAKNTWSLRNKYDRFSRDDPDNYYGFQVAFKYDEFADLDLRTSLGPYIGRQFFETDYLSLHAELGIAYVDEQFNVAEDDDFWGSNWEVRLSSGIIPGTDLYVLSEGVMSFADTDEIIANTTVGLKFPLIFGFQTAAEALYQYDGGAVEGVDTTDETFRFKLGYSWK